MLKSNGLRHSKNPPVKFGFSPKTVSANIVKKLPAQRCSKPFFNFSHKRPTFAFTSESGYTIGFRRRIAHSGLHAETGGVSDGGGITTLGAFRTFTNIPGPGIRTANFAAFGSWSETLLKNAESLRSSDALMRVAVPRRRGPAGLRDLFTFVEMPDGRLSKRLIGRFLGLTGSSLIPAAQNMFRFLPEQDRHTQTAPVPCERNRSCFLRHFMERARKAAICALVQVAVGSNLPPPTPWVMPFSTAQATACA